ESAGGQLPAKLHRIGHTYRTSPMSIRQNFSLPRIRLAIQRWRSDKRGSVAIMVGFMAIAFTMMLGMVVEEALIYRTTTALKASRSEEHTSELQSLTNL